MMTSSNGNIFRVTGHLYGEFPTQRPVTRSFDVSLICVWINSWVNTHEAGDLRRWHAHCDVTVMVFSLSTWLQFPTNCVPNRSILPWMLLVISDRFIDSSGLISNQVPGGRFKNAYELLNLRALEISMLYKNHIFQCMSMIFCVEFQRVPLKFNTKYHTHTLKDVDFIRRWQFKSS